MMTEKIKKNGIAEAAYYIENYLCTLEE